MKKSIREYSLNIPNKIPFQIKKAETPLLTAYGCILIERDTGRSYVYTAVNLMSLKKDIVHRSKNPLTTSGIDMIVEKIRNSKIANAGRYEADRPLKNKVTIKNCHDQLTLVFKELLPQYGFTIRGEQISLANHILDAIYKGKISLAEAEVGTGKTLAYLVPAILAKRGKLNGYFNMGLDYYSGTSYIELQNMPIVIATSSIALQKAIITDYIPQLSDILLKYKIIKKPLTAALRKGRNNYICIRNLKAHITNERDPKTLKLLEGLLEPTSPIDIAEIDGINDYIKRRVSVPTRCDKYCPYRNICRYISFRKQVQSSGIDIQVCNHNYLLADVINRSDDKQSLIPNYQTLIIDEAHKFLSAARDMYGNELSYMSIMHVVQLVQSLKFNKGLEQKAIYKITGSLAKESARLFNRLEKLAGTGDIEDDTDRYKAVIDSENLRHIQNIYKMAESLYEKIKYGAIRGNGNGRKEQLLLELEQIIKQSEMFIRHKEHVCWLEVDKQIDSRLCAIPKDIDKQLYSTFWSRGIPTILTSGTLSAAGDFSRIKQSLGINYISQYRVNETSKSSPFDYYNNSMLYIPDTMPFPDQSNDNYILSTANEIEKLVRASHGHAAVLFTSYKVMDKVWEILRKRNIPFPLFRLNKGGVREIERFKKSGNGILFASGALWEGIDIPGDILSMLIIVKLPFQAPDPISEYEISLCKDFDEYLETALKPDMLIKLKQGYGRAIRLESDTAVIAILDSRVSIYGVYRDYVLNGLPRCYLTSRISEVNGFFRVKKSVEYFK